MTKQLMAAGAVTTAALLWGTAGPAAAAFQGLFLAAAQSGSPVVVTLLSVAVGPPAALGVRLVSRRCRPKLLCALAAGTSGVGTATVVIVSHSRWQPTVLAVVASLAFAGYATASSRMTGNTVRDEIGITAGVLLGAGAVLAIPDLLFAGSVHVGRAALAVSLYLGLVATALAYGLFSRGTRVLGSSGALALTAVQPLAALATSAPSVSDWSSLGSVGFVAALIGLTLPSGRSLLATRKEAR